MEQDGGWKSARKSIDKSLLKNIIRHTDSHNKIQEQNEMWKQWELKKQKHDRQLHRHDDHARGYMRSDIELSPAAKKESLKWNRLLLEYEETRSDRWGHSGYKELYPDEFQPESNHEVESDESETKKEVKIGNESSSEKKEKKKEKPRMSRKPRKVKSDSDDSDVNKCLSKSKKYTKSKNLDNVLKKFNNERKKKIELNMDSKIKRVDEKGGTKNKYIDFDLKSRDTKRKIKPEGGLRNDRRDRKRKSEFKIFERDVGIERNDRKRNTGDTSRKLSRTVESNHSSRKKRKMKH